MNETEKSRDTKQTPDDQGPIAGIEALRRDQSPHRDLWPGIESRIRARRSQFWRSSWLIAAGIAVIAMIGTNAVLNRVHTPLDAPSAPLRAPADVVAATLPGRDAAVLLSASTRQWHPETKALVRTNLKIVNNAEVQLRKAMESDPDAAYLQSLLAATHQQKKQLKYQLAMND